MYELKFGGFNIKFGGIVKGGEGKFIDFIHLIPVHQGKCKSLEVAMYMNEVRDSSRGDLGKERNICSNEVRSANLVDKDSSFKVIAISEIGVKCIGKLGG